MGIKKGEPLISVIVPVYKVEEYIQECIESVLDQTLADFQLILVDDGSPDSCGEICEMYATRDARVYVIHKENGGLSDARNVGLEKASGEYVFFLDSDDALAPNALKILYEVACREKADIVQGQFTNDKMQLEQKIGQPMTVLSSEQALSSLLLMDEVQVMAWAKLYSRKLFKEIRYPVGKINEDNFTTYKLVCKAEKVALLPDLIYYYRINPTSIMNCRITEKRFEILNSPKEILNYLGDSAEKFQEQLEYYKFRILIRLYNEVIVQNAAKEFGDYLYCIRTEIKQMDLSNQYLSLKYKVLSWILIHNAPVYSVLVKMLRKKLRDKE